MANGLDVSVGLGNFFEVRGGVEGFPPTERSYKAVLWILKFISGYNTVLILEAGWV